MLPASLRNVRRGAVGVGSMALLVALATPTGATAQATPSGQAIAPGCVVPEDALKFTYPDDKMCWKYEGSSVLVDFVLRDATEYGLREAPMDPAYYDDGKERVVGLVSRTTIVDFVLKCDVVVVHEWVRVLPCETPVKFKLAQKTLFKSPSSSPSVAIGSATDGLRGSMLRGHSFREVLDTAKSAAPNEQCWTALDTALTTRTSGATSEAAKQLRVCGAYAREFGAARWGNPLFTNPVRPSQAAGTRLGAAPKAPAR